MDEGRGRGEEGGAGRGGLNGVMNLRDLFGARVCARTSRERHEGERGHTAFEVSSASRALRAGMKAAGAWRGG